jgi:hypothetical protein
MATGSRARLVGRNLFDLLNERYGANSASAEGGGRARSDAAPQAGARQAVFSPDKDETAFQRVCYDYNADGTCNVISRATPPNTPREKGRPSNAELRTPSGRWSCD